MSVTLTFNDEIDASRGDTIVHAEASPTITNDFEAMLVWMHEEELSPGREYVIKHGPNRTYGTVDRIINRVDVNTLDEHDASRLALNEIARVAIRTSAPMVLDDYQNNRGTGAFVIIDRLTNVTVGAGMIRSPGRPPPHIGKQHPQPELLAPKSISQCRIEFASTSTLPPQF